MTVSEIFDHHIASALSQYRGNLEFLERIMQAGEMPDAADPAVRSHLTELKQFFSSRGVQETDEFVLRFGLVAPGAYRGIHPPISVLSPDRGGFSQKRLQQAADQAGRLREALTLGRQFFSNLSTDTESALKELTARAPPPVVSDEEWAGAHSSLSPTEAAELKNLAFKCLDDPAKSVHEVGISVLQTLADCSRDGLAVATGWLAERGIHYPGSLYRGAPNEVASRLVSEIPTAGRLQLNHLLLALAWTRGEIAHDTFLGWKSISPAWTSQLYVPVQDYLHSAGWALNEDGTRRDLIALSCHLILKKQYHSDPSLAVPCRIPAEKKCPACEGGLSWLFDFCALPERFFSGERKGAPRKVLCCLNCACFSPIFTRYQSNGAAEWHPATVSGEIGPPGTWPSCECQLSASVFPPFAAANPFRLDDASTLGGIPMWLQDAEYPRCPDCARPMQFLAQFYNLAMPKPEEGIFYSFFCPDCQVAAVNYQQT